MVFASPVFLFVFFPVVLLVYRLIPAKVRPYWLLLSSLFFYFWRRERRKRPPLPS